MISCLRNCFTCVPCRRNNTKEKLNDEEFQLKHIVLTKGPYIVVVYFNDEDKGNEEVQKYLNDHYRRLENIAHSVRLSKVSEYTSNIFVEEEEESVLPDTTVPVCYKNLQQECVVHRVRFKSSKPGDHYLQLQIAEGTTGKHRYPFDITINPDDLYEAPQNTTDQGTSRLQDYLYDEPGVMNTTSVSENISVERKKRGKFQLKHAVLAKGLYVVIVYFINDATGESEVEKYTRDHYERVDNVSHGVRLDKDFEYTSNIISEDSAAEIRPDTKVAVSYDALQQECIVHRVRIKSSTEGEHCLQLQIKMGSKEMHGYAFDVTLRRADLYGNQYSGPKIGYYPMIRRTPPPLVFRAKKSLNRGNADGYFEPTTETLTATMQIKNTGYEESIEDIKTPLLEKTHNPNLTMQGRQLPPTPQDFNVDQMKDKIDLMEMLKKLNMENLMSVFEKKKISHDRILEMNSEDFANIGIKVLEARRIMEAVRNYRKKEIEPEHFYDYCG